MNVKEAVDIAMSYVSTFDAVFPTKGRRFEETEVDDAGNWLITLSFIDKDPFETRIFKRFSIDPSRKEVIAMKIRNPLTA